MRHPTADSSWFTFETPAVSGFRVYAFSGVEEMHRPYEFEIELVHDLDNLDFATLLGRTACLSIRDKSGGVRHVHGVIHRFLQLHTSNQRTHYRCLLVPRLHFLNQVTDHRIFQNMSVTQIIEKILKEQNFTGDSFAFKCFFDYAPREYCVQYGETHLHFISRLCEEEGLYFYFDHFQDLHVLCFSDMPDGPRIEGESLVRFHPGAGTETDTATVRSIEMGRDIRSDSFTFREWNFEKTRLDLQVKLSETDPVKAPVPVGMNLEQYRYPHLYQLQKDGKRYVDLELLRNFSMSVWVDVTTDVSRMTPGYVFELFGHRREDYNAKWWVVRVEHRGEQPQVLEHEAPDRGMIYGAQVRAIPNTTRFIPASEHPGNRIYGVQTAIVTGPDGEEIFPDQYGRVKVQFHWDRLGAWDENTTCWIRASQGWAGGQFGTMAIPRIGQEVLVSFLEGNPERPVITGRVFNSARPVPYPLPANKTRTVFKSMSTPGAEGESRGFNELRIEDKKGQEEIYAHAEKDVNVYVKNDWKEHILHDQHRTIDNFSYSIVKGEDHQTVEKDRKVELLSDDHLTVTGSRHRKIAKKWLVRTGDETHFISDIKTILEAGTELTIKAGGSFIKLDPSGVTIKGAKVKINSGGSPGMGPGARPLLPVDSKMVDKAAVPQSQELSVRQGKDLPLCKICEESDHSSNGIKINKPDYKGDECYYDTNEEFKISKVANIMTDGSGVLHPGASFYLSGIVRTEPGEPQKLFVSCEGYTAIENLADSVKFWAEATLKNQHGIISKRNLIRSKYGYLRSYPHKSHIIGEAIFILPHPSDEGNLTLHLRGSYIANFSTGAQVPSFAAFGIPNVIAEKIFEIKIKKRKKQ